MSLKSLIHSAAPLAVRHHGENSLLRNCSKSSKKDTNINERSPLSSKGMSVVLARGPIDMEGPGNDQLFVQR